MLSTRLARHSWSRIGTSAIQRPSHQSFRSLTTRTLTRPTIFARSPLNPRHILPTASSELGADIQVDLLPKISAHPALQSIQVRNGPRDTYNPSHRVRKRRFGFLARLRSRTGRKILVRRKLKRRRSLSH